MENQKIVSRTEWIEARKAHLAKEKEFTKMRDQLSRERRELPWVKVDKAYQFETNDGPKSLADLFDGRSQLLVYHFMYGVDWEEGCPSCSFWADNYDGTEIHLNHRDISLVVISSADLDKLNAYKSRMGWGFNWVSAKNSDFNQDYQVTASADEIANERYTYNFVTHEGRFDERPGLSTFYKDENGDVFHTYSSYARGMDMLNGTYHHMDLMPKGRDEDSLPWSMAWLRRNDQYEK